MGSTSYIANFIPLQPSDAEIQLERQRAADEQRTAEYNVKSARRVLDEAERRLREVQTYIDWLAGIQGKQQ